MARNPKPLRQEERRLLLRSPYGFTHWKVVNDLIHYSWISWTDRIRFNRSLLKGEDRWEVVVNSRDKLTMLRATDLPSADEGIWLERDGVKVRVLLCPSPRV